MINHRIKLSFNKACETYDAHSGVQQTIGNELLEIIKQYLHQKSIKNIIDLG
jgi:hypothetical protein